MNLIKNKLRVLHYPNVPCKPFEVEVKDEFEAYKICEVIATQHLWLFENKFIPDYANVIIVQMWDEEECMEWEEFMENYLDR